MALPWYRSFSSDLRDALIQNLSLQDFKHWQNLQWLANEQEPRGHLPGPEQVGYNLHISAAKAAQVLLEFRGRGLLEPDKSTGRLVPFNWDRQRDSDDRGAYQRQKRSEQKGELHLQREPSQLPLSSEHVPNMFAPEEEERRTEQEESRGDRDREAEEEADEIAQVRRRCRASGIAWVGDEAIGFAVGYSGLDCVLHCLDEAVRYNRPSWAYADEVRKRHEAEGCPVEAGMSYAEKLASRRD